MTDADHYNYSHEDHPASYDQKLAAAQEALASASSWIVFTLENEEDGFKGQAFFAKRPEGQIVETFKFAIVMLEKLFDDLVEEEQIGGRGDT